MSDIRFLYVGDTYEADLTADPIVVVPVAGAPDAPTGLSAVVANACDKVKAERLYSPTFFGYVADVVQELAFLDAVNLVTEAEEPFDASVIY